MKQFSAIILFIGILFIPLNLTAHTVSGHTIFDMAEYGKIDAIISYINSGNDINAREGKSNNYSGTGMTLIMWAASNSQIEVMNILIKAGVDINIEDERGWTALMEAVCSEVNNSDNERYIDAIKILLSAGANPSAINKKGTSILELAEERGGNEVIRLVNNALVNYEKSNIEVIDIFSASKKGDINMLIKYIKEGVFKSLLGN